MEALDTVSCMQLRTVELRENVDDVRGRLKASNVFFTPSFPSTLRLSLLFLLSSSTKSESTASSAIFDSWCRLFRMVGSFGVSGLRSGASLSPHYGSEHPNDGDLHFHSQTGLKRISSVASHRRKRKRVRDQRSDHRRFYHATPNVLYF